MRILLLFFFIVFLDAEQILKYDVKVHIFNDGKLDVVENILYDFGSDKRHGIFRNIPINHNKIELISIKKDNNTVHYESSYINNDIVFKIGDKNILLSGKHLYTIHYTLDNVVFNKGDKNIISFNAIGTGWKIIIHNIKIDIFLPKILTNAKIKVFEGQKGSKIESVYHNINLNHYQITKKYLLPFQGITFDISFDKNLIKVKTLSNVWAIIFLIIFTIGVYIYYSKHKIPYIAVSPQYYPPKNLDILKVGLLIDQTADLKDFSSAILELATKKYLKIVVKKDKIFGVFNSETIILEKLKNADGLDFDQQTLFNTIFYNQDQFILGQKSISTANRLQNMISKINQWLYNWAIKEKYFTGNPKNAQLLFMIKTGAFIVPFFIYAFSQMLNFYGNIIIFEMIIIIFLIIGVLLIFKEGIKSKIIGVILLVVFYNILVTTIISLVNPLSIVMLGIIPVILFSKKISSYSIKGINTLKYLLGLKEFILKVEKDKLEFLLKENPNYLDEMLPYAVLFGAEYWFEFYDEFNIDKSWYLGEYDNFHRLDKSLVDSFDSTANYTETSTSDSFSGGGSVGSGSGGGGGGSW